MTWVTWALLALGAFAAGSLAERLAGRLGRFGCRGCGHTSEAAGCGCLRQNCVCRAEGRARFNAAVATLNSRDQEWLAACRARIAAVLADAGIDTSTYDPSLLDPDRLEDIIATVDMSELRRIFRHQIAEAEDPAAMRGFLDLLLSPGTGARFSDPDLPEPR